MTRRAKEGSHVSASEIMANIDVGILCSVTAQVLVDGGAVMFGQTRDKEKLIVTVYMDGERNVEYCSDAAEAEAFLASWRV